MHARSVDHQSALASQGIVDRQHNHTRGGKHANQQQQQTSRENVQLPGVLTEEAMVVRKMPLPDRSARHDQVGNEAMAM